MSSMHATPDAYRCDIARTKEGIATLERSPIHERSSGRHIVRHRMLLRRLAALEAGLARAEQEGAAAPARGAGERVEEGR